MKKLLNNINTFYYFVTSEPFTIFKYKYINSYYSIRYFKDRFDLAYQFVGTCWKISISLSIKVKSIVSIEFPIHFLSLSLSLSLSCTAHDLTQCILL